MKLEILQHPQKCSIANCDQTAYWSIDDQPVCHADFLAMSDMNSDNERAFYLPIITPVVLHREMTMLITWCETSLDALCAAINAIPMCTDFEVCSLDAEGIKVGHARYQRISARNGCIAPRVAGKETGELEGLSDFIKKRAIKVTKCLDAEFREDELPRCGGAA